MKHNFLLLLIWLVVLIWSAINPHDYLTWWLEVTPGIIGGVILIAIYKRFRFTSLVYFLILIHCSILFVGGKYTYAENPLFHWIQTMLHGERNEYDKLGHFVQGFVPTMVARELLLRLNVLNRRKWLPLFLVSITMLISSSYELIEWCASVLTGEGAEAFLGTQGYVWDTQSDMLFALIGSISAILLLSRLHDKKLETI